MNYIKLCQAFVAELGISGGTGPSSTTGNTDPDLVNVVNWIAQANDYINNLHLDWDFLWVRFVGALSVGVDQAPLPTGTAMKVRVIDQLSAFLNFGTAQPTRLTWLNYQVARRRWMFQKTANRPTFFTRRPDGVIELNYLPTLADAIQYDYWGVPSVLNDGSGAQDSNVPLLPADFHRIILVRAKLMYAEHEDAPEVMSGAAAEYKDLLEKLEAAYWPGNEAATMAHSNNPDLQFSGDDGGMGGDNFGGNRFA